MLHRASIASRGACPVDHPLAGFVAPFPRQHLPLWAALDVALAVVGEGSLVIVGRRLVPFGQRHVGADALFLQGADVLACRVLGVGDETLGPELATEQSATELVEQDLVLGHVARRHQAVEDDSGLAAVDQVVILVAEDSAPIPHRHGRRIRVGAADLARGEPTVRPGRRAVLVQSTRLQEVAPSGTVWPLAGGTVWGSIAGK